MLPDTRPGQLPITAALECWIGCIGCIRSRAGRLWLTQLCPAACNSRYALLLLLLLLLLRLLRLLMCAGLQLW
jgi:hypothetical protein